MKREQWLQNLMYFSAAGASVSLAFFVALKFATHAKAQTPPPAPAKTAAPAAPTAAAATPATTPAPPAAAAPAKPAAAAANAAPTAAPAPTADAAATAPNAAAPAPAAGTPAQPGTPPGAPANGIVDPDHLTPQETSEINKLEGFLEPFLYDVVNRRDPFLPFAEYVPNDNGPQGRALSPAQRYDLDQLRLVGVMWDIKDPKAMFMDPESEIITLGRDEGIGNRNGYIASIREGEVVVVEAIRKRGDVVYKTRVLHLER